MTTVAEPTATSATIDTGAFVERLLGSFLGTADVFAIYLGYRLGWYDSLAKAGPASAAELARRTGTNERYAREWLEQQVVSEILVVDDARKSAEDRVYAAPPATAEALADRESPNFIAPLAQAFAAATRQSEKLVEAYRSGGGVSWAEFGDEIRRAQGDQNRVFFQTTLTRDILPAIADVHARLLAEPSALVADIACGVGWAALAIATAYPRARVDGYDIDVPTIDIARRNLAASHVADRVRFEARDGSDPRLAGRYDLVLIAEALHDMSQPVEVLRNARQLLSENGVILVIDENTGASFAEPGPLDRLFYGFSLLCCLPDGMSHRPTAATGTVMRPSTLRRYATAAGFRDVETVDVDAGFFRVYRLVR